MIAKDILVLSVEEEKYELVANNDVEWVVDLTPPTMLSLQKGFLARTKHGPSV